VSPSVPVEALAWEQVGVLGAPRDTRLRLIAFDGGYVAYGIEDGYGAEIWFSADGRAWERTALAEMRLNCPGMGPDGDDYVPDADVGTGTSNGALVLLAGTELTETACEGGDGTNRMVTWISSDGRTWQRSEGFEAAKTNALATGSWSTDEGWWLVDEASGGVWLSDDGLEWGQVDVGIRAPGGLSPNAVSDGVTVVGNVIEPYVDGVPQASRRTYQSWQPLVLPEACSAYVSTFHAPDRPGSGPWVLVGSADHDGAEPWFVCASPDLEAWTSTQLPTEFPASIASLANTRYGVLASLYCDDTSCPTTPEGNSAGPSWQFLSADGRTWTALGNPINTQAAADGPAGVIAIATGGTVQRLVDTRPASESPAISSAPGAGWLGSTWVDATVQGLPRWAAWSRSRPAVPALSSWGTAASRKTRMATARRRRGHPRTGARGGAPRHRRR
jgi:hypothetical protein